MTEVPLRGGKMGEFPEMNPGPVCLLSPEATVVLANAAARRAFGEDRLVGGCWFELCPNLTGEAWDEAITSGSLLSHEEEIDHVCFAFTIAPRQAGDGAFVYGADVTELKRAQEVLASQASELQEMALFPEMNPGPVCRIQLDGTVLRANSAARSLFGEGLIGSCWRDIVAGMDTELWERIVAEGAQVTHEAAVDEKTFAFTMSHPEHSQYVFVYGADVTELKKAEREVAEMARFPDMNPGPVLRLDRDGCIVLANRAARALFGGERLVGKLWQELCPGMTQGFLEEVLGTEELGSHETQVRSQHILFTHRRGREYVFVYGADLTELKVAERTLRQTEKMATLGTLAAGVAHELNNPSAAVQRAAEHLQKTFTLLQQAQIALGRLRLDADLLDLLTKLDASAS